MESYLTVSVSAPTIWPLLQHTHVMMVSISLETLLENVLVTGSHQLGVGTETNNPALVRRYAYCMDGIAVFIVVAIQDIFS